VKEARPGLGFDDGLISSTTGLEDELVDDIVILLGCWPEGL